MNEYHPTVIFTDGASRGNPGPGGFGVVIINRVTHMIHEIGGYEAVTTNNAMELWALYEAIRYLAEQKNFSATIFMDSKYVYQGVTQWRHGWAKNGWKTKEDEPIKNQTTWQHIHEALSDKQWKLEFIHISGHMDIEGNERADAIASHFAYDQKFSTYSGPLDATKQLYTHIPSREEIEKIRERKRARTQEDNCTYLSCIDGIVMEHTTWAETEARVKGKKASFKKVCSEEEKAEILAKWGIKK